MIIKNLICICLQFIFSVGILAANNVSTDLIDEDHSRQCEGEYLLALKTSKGNVNSAKKLKKQKKKTCILYGNCQMSVLASFLQTHFPNEYEYTFVIKFQDKVPLEKISKADVFIYQPTQGKTAPQNTDYLLANYVKKNCICVSVPFAFFYGYFPDFFEDQNNIKTVSPQYIVGAFPYGNQHIAYYINKGYSARKIIELSKEDNFLSEDFIRKRMNDGLAELRIKEQETKIKIADFIEANYARVKLFHAAVHPTNIVLKEMVRQVLSLLKLPVGVVDSSTFFNVEIMNNMSPIIYPCVAKALELQFDTSYAIFWNEVISYDKYINDYMKFLYPDQYYKN